MRILVLTAHPESTSFNATLSAAYARGAEAAGATVETVDLTRLVFDPILRGAYREPMIDEPDLERMRERFLAADHIAWFFPVWWAAVPAVVKALVDRLLLPGWAYRFDGGPLPTGLLAGRSTRYVATMDSPRLWYLLAQHDALAGSFGRGTLSFVGLSPIERTLIYRARELSKEARAGWAEKLLLVGGRDTQRVGRRLARLPQRAPLAIGAGST